MMDKFREIDISENICINRGYLIGIVGKEKHNSSSKKGRKVGGIWIPTLVHQIVIVYYSLEMLMTVLQ